uniref:Uncharacterized protein n=1 Tax=Fagus sylvatica TaxID=28930 RepID=A0A2N9ECZ1_FAGSY
MEPENIDWNSVESIFEEDDTYENFDAPQWVDLSAPDETIDDRAWFCNPDCKHPKNAEDFLKPTQYLKVKLLRSLSISEILPFRDRNRRDLKLKGKEINSFSQAAKIPNPKSLKTKGSNEDSENKNPNIFAPIANDGIDSKKAAMKTSNEKKIRKQLNDESSENSFVDERKPQLKSSFSAHNLLGGQEILNQITEFCCELKKLGRKSWKKPTAGE